MRLLTLAAIVVAALTFTTATASAGGLCRGGGGNGRQGGPVRNLVGRIADRAQERRAVRAPSCPAPGQAAASACPGCAQGYAPSYAPPATYSAQPYYGPATGAW